MHFGEHCPQGIRPLSSAECNQRLPLGLSSRANVVFVKRGGTLSLPHRPGDGISALGDLSQFTFWIWVVKNSCLPSPNLLSFPIEEEIYHFLPKQRLWAQRRFWWSAPLTCWIGGLSLEFFYQAEENLLLEKILLSLSSAPLGKTPKWTQSDFCSLIFYSILKGQ